MAAPKQDKIYTAIVLDFETGGTDPQKDAATQLAMHAVRLDTFEVFAKYNTYFEMYCAPEKKTKTIKRKKKSEVDEGPQYMGYDWEMMKKYTGITKKMLEDHGRELPVIVDEIIEFAKKAQLTKGKDTPPIIVGQNIGFDVGFLYQIFDFAGKSMKGAFAGADGYHGFLPHTIDTINLGRLMLDGDKSVTSYKLEVFAEKMEIDLVDAHDADADVEATNEILKGFASRLRSGDGTGLKKAARAKTRDHWNFKIEKKNGKG